MSREKKNLLSKRENGLVWLGREKLNMKKKKKKRQPLNQRPFLKEDRRNEKRKNGNKMCACACC
jgi:hypothetical protein